MANIKNTFHLQTMDKETDSAFVENGRTRHVENLRFGTNGGNDGIGVNIKGTSVVLDLTEGNSDFKCVGAKHNESDNVIYFMLATSDGAISKIAEYNISSESGETILHDTEGILALNKNGYITGINEIDGLLYWSEWGNNPRRTNIVRAKNYGVNGFTEEDIQVAVIPPFNKPKITLQDSGSEENNIKERMFSFSYQYKYLDGEYSTPSPFSEFAFQSENFEYDFAEQSNKSMVNAFNQVKIEFNTGNERVAEIRLIYKESQSNSEWIIDDFNKESLGYGHNETKEFLFDNSKKYRALDDSVIRNYSNAVPRTNKAQTIIDGRLLYAYYLDQYNITEEGSNVKIDIDFSLELIAIDNTQRVPNENPVAIVENILDTTVHSTVPSSLTLTITSTGLLDYDFIPGDPVRLTEENSGAYTVVSASDTTLVLLKKELPYPTFSGSESDTIILSLKYQKRPTLIAKKTVKSFRDYEVTLLYLDGVGRSSALLASKTNTLNIPITNSVTENKIRVNLFHKPPSFAKYFRFFIKQPKKDYEQIIPTFFYEDNIYRWVKIEGSEVDKIRKGDFLIVKSDSQGIKSSLIRTKVLEVKEQEKNFLQPSSVNQSIVEVPGYYFKIKPDGYRVDRGDYIESLLDMYTTSTTNKTSPFPHIIATLPSIGFPNFYGDTLDDLTVSGSYTGGAFSRSRFNIFIDSVGATDTFKWNEDGGAFTNNVPITGSPQLLSNGVSISFGATTGHSLSDEWTVSARGEVQDDSAKAFAFFTKKIDPSTSFDLENEKIYIGDLIRLKYDEYNNENRFFEIIIASNGEYNNIEEWFFRENVLSEMQSQFSDLSIDNIFFVRGFFTEEFDTLVSGDNLNPTSVGYMTMVIRSLGTQNNAIESKVKLRSQTEILSQEGKNLLIFETDPKEEPEDVYFEIGKTYQIENGFHKSDSENIPTDVDQDNGVPLSVTLDFFNAFSYGNSVESYKVKDEFNAKGLDIGVKPLTVPKEEYKEIIRKTDVTWSGTYQYEGEYNGLGTFNLSELNFITLDQEEGSIQLIDNDNGNLLIFQEDAIGRMPYNKNVIYDTEGGRVVGISNNVLDRKSYAPYANGRYGTRHPESYVSRGGRKYVIDQSRGKLLRLSADGITPVSDKLFEHYFSRLMSANRNTFMVAGYDPKHGEYLFNIKNLEGIQGVQESEPKPSVFSFKEKAGGFPLIYTYDPDFLLEADNEIYAWKNGVMYKLNASETRNNFFGTQYNSLIKFFVNQEYSIEKVFNSIGIESSHPWAVKLKTELTSRLIPKNSFSKIEDYWFSEIMGNTNGNSKSSSVFGLGEYEIQDGVITTSIKYPSLSVGDFISSKSLLFPPNKVLEINDTNIVLETNTTTVSSFLFYSKNQNIDGGDIRGDVLEIEMVNEESAEVKLRAVNTNVTKSNYS